MGFQNCIRTANTLRRSALTAQLPSPSRSAFKQFLRIKGPRRVHLTRVAAMEADMEEIIEKIHSTPFKLVLYVTGGAAKV